MRISTLILVTSLNLAGTSNLFAQADTLKINWDAPTKELKTTATLQVVVNAKLRRGSNIHDAAFEALKNIECDYVRFCPWFPYPRLGVAELDAPKDGKTSWDFSLMDPLVEDLMNATKGHPVVMTFSTTPQWMWESEWYTGAPADPNMEEWGYNVGTKLKDTTGKQVGEYFKRVYQWYAKGGFTDELGKKHVSNHHYPIAAWEVLNEPDGEHSIDGKLYNKIYDASALQIRETDPNVKFVGASLMRIKESTPDFMETFLNPRNHKKGVPLDYVSYHAYVWINQKRGVNAEQYTAFEQARQFIEQFYFIDAMRKRLSPQTKTMINEVGTIRNDDSQNTNSEIEPWYWGLSAGVFAYLYSEMADMGVDVVGESQLVGYPNQFPCVTLVDWTTGKPNLRYWVLKLIRDQFTPGDRIGTWSKGVDTQGDYYARTFIDKAKKKKLLIINLRNKALDVVVPGSNHATVEFVDDAALAVQKKQQETDKVALRPFAVAIVTMP